MEYQQGFLGRVVDIGAELFAMAAAVRPRRDAARRRREPATAAYELADAFCQQSRLRVEALFDRAVDQHRRRRHATGRAACSAGDYTWLEEGVLDQSEGTGPWIAPWQEGPSQSESVARRYLPSTREG